jgi:hypothetical protein
LLSDSSKGDALQILNNSRQKRIHKAMKHITLSFLTAFVLSFPVTASAADCFADYKAKQDDPLRLHYGVAQLRGACDRGSAQAELSARLRAQGWTLLNIVSTFGPEGLAQRKSSAGSNYLRF